MEPELEHQRAFVAEHALEARDFFDALDQPRVIACAIDAVQDRLCIPVAEQDADFPLGRQCPPVTPHARPLAFLV